MERSVTEAQLKKELLSNYFDKTVKSATKDFGTVFDSIDAELVLNKMVEACTCSFEDLVTCDQFLSSDMMKRYNEALSNMAGVFMDEAMKHILANTSATPESNTKH